MANIKVSEMTQANSVNDADLLMIVQSNQNKKTTKQILLNGLETATNKVTSISSSSTDTQYPSAKCVYDLVGDIESILEELDIRRWC